jgi:hypothetical protein
LGSFKQGDTTVRNFILTASVLLLCTAAAHAETRGLIMASNDDTAKVEQTAPTTQADQATQPTQQAAPIEAAKPVKPRVVSKPRETDEQKARRIAARYGISW